MPMGTEPYTTKYSMSMISESLDLIEIALRRLGEMEPTTPEELFQLMGSYVIMMRAGMMLDTVRFYLADPAHRAPIPPHVTAPQWSSDVRQQRS